MGDFNTRTGDKTDGPSDGKYYPVTTDFGKLKQSDEMSGRSPYGTDESWKGNFLGYINKIQAKSFVEEEVGFVPTYSIKPAKDFCGGMFPCYRVNRPLSWTDRIVYTSGVRCIEYVAIMKEYGDHFPVSGVYAIP